MPPLELAIVVPTFNERKNVQELLHRLARTLHGIQYEVIFVDDDSPDGTADVVRSIAIGDPRVRVLQRVRRRGLASACVEGMMATPAPYIAIMDADLQHDEAILPQMLEKLKAENLDLVVATRNAEGGSMGEFAAWRVRLSQFGRRLSNSISRCDLSDPMSGFFILDRRFLEEIVRSISAIGFKILLDIVASSPRPVRLGEVPYRFRARLYGESKLDVLVGIEYLQLLLDKKIGEIIPARFVIFGMVGAMGVIVHLSILFVLLRLEKETLLVAQGVATVIVMTLNFFLNNAITYRDRRLRGRRLIIGLLSFYGACSVGAFVNIRVAEFVLEGRGPWYLAGLAGLVVSSVWNYGVTAMFTWHQGRRAAAMTRRSPAALSRSEPELPS
jgi:dolichol-phosphate mannosyltransferase